MYYKNESDKDRIKKEIKFNEEVEKSLKSHDFEAVYTKQPDLKIILNDGNKLPKPRPWLKLSTKKEWSVAVLVIGLIAFCVLLILTRVTQDIQPKETPEVHTTAPISQSVHSDRIKVSIIINNATVPQMDSTFKGIFNSISRADPFVLLYLIDDKDHIYIGETPVKRNTMSPVWNHAIEKEIDLKPNDVLNLEVWDLDKIGKNERIGKTFVRVYELVNQGMSGQMICREYMPGYYIWLTVNWR